MRQTLATLRRVAGITAAGGCLFVSGISAALWLWTTQLSSVGLFALGDDTSLNLVNGVAEFDHRYDYGFAPPVPDAQWHNFAVSRGWTVPPRPQRWEMAWPSLSSDHVTGMSSSEVRASVTPTRYWLLRIPLWPLVVPGIVVSGLLAARHRRRRNAGQRGFSIDAPSRNVA